MASTVKFLNNSLNLRSGFDPPRTEHGKIIQHIPRTDFARVVAMGKMPSKFQVRAYIKESDVDAAYTTFNDWADNEGSLDTLEWTINSKKYTAKNCFLHRIVKVGVSAAIIEVVLNFEIIAKSA